MNSWSAKKLFKLKPFLWNKTFEAIEQRKSILKNDIKYFVCCNQKYIETVTLKNKNEVAQNKNIWNLIYS
jgi:hypothetical protein